MAVSVCIHTQIYPNTGATSWKTHPFLSFAAPRYQMLGMSYPAASLLTKFAARQAWNRSIFPPFVAFQCAVRGAPVRVPIRPSARLGGCSLPTFSRCCFESTVQEVEQESPPFLDLPQRVPAAVTQIPHEAWKNNEVFLILRVERTVLALIPRPFVSVIRQYIRACQLFNIDVLIDLYLCVQMN